MISTSSLDDVPYPTYFGSKEVKHDDDI
jgi:hypothetical protein